MTNEPQRTSAGRLMVILLHVVVIFALCMSLSRSRKGFRQSEETALVVNLVLIRAVSGWDTASSKVFMS